MKPRISMRGSGSRLVAALLLLTITSFAFAADAPSITVVATGSAKAKPTQAEIGAVVTGGAELASDAVVKYRDTKRRALEAIKNLNLTSVSVEESGLGLSSTANLNPQIAQMMGNQGQADTKGKFQVAERLRVIIKGVDQLEAAALTDTLVKVMDTMKDAGLALGESPSSVYEMQLMMMRGGGANTSTVVFRVTDSAGLRQKAYEAAMSDAKKRAARLAELSGAKLGAVVSVHEGNTPAAGDSNVNIYMAMMGASRPAGEEGTTSATFQEVPVNVTLTVQFAMEK